tara:strand:- start:748 stop:888 length:141 start_codon:yes stop_codon:yes gene_type:complete
VTQSNYKKLIKLENKKKLKDLRLQKLEKKLKSNILKRKKNIKTKNG